MSDLVIKHGDTAPVTLTVTGPGGVVDLTGATVRLLVRAKTRGATTAVLAPAITTPTAGVVTWTPDGTLAPGAYDVELEVTRGGLITTAPTAGHITLRVDPDLG